MKTAKIKIVDVRAEGEEVIEKTYNEVLAIQNEPDSESESEAEPEPKPKPEPEPTKTKQRVQELEECERCGKMLTKKSLRYTHRLHCGVVKEVKPKPAAKPKPVVGRSLYQSPPPPPPVQQSFEEMRRERIIQRMNDKRESAKQLFLQAI